MASSSTKGASTASSNPGEQILQLATGYMAPACLYIAAKLRIADQLADGPKVIAELAGKARGVHENSLYRVMRALASVGVFTETEPRTFANTAASELLRARVPGSMREVVLWTASPTHLRVFAELRHAVETGDMALKKVTGLDAFEYLKKNPAEDEAFNAAMSGLTANFAPAVLEAYDFSGLGTVADIGGGHGKLMTEILKKHYGLRGIVFDAPHVVAGAGPHIESMGLGERCRTTAGDFFQAAPEADSYVLKSVIHDWNDASAISVLQNCVTAMRGEAGKVLLLEMVLQPGNEHDIGKWIDLEMLMMAGGHERTEAEFAELLSKAGLRLTRVVRTKSPVCVIESVRA
ncbi:MAG: methyltransferase [Candidatus Acidiferrales bacterium]